MAVVQPLYQPLSSPTPAQPCRRSSHSLTSELYSPLITLHRPSGAGEFQNRVHSRAPSVSVVVAGGYYAGFAFQELAKLTKDFLPKFEQAYYIHNFKGTRPGALFRAYPGPWWVAVGRLSSVCAQWRHRALEFTSHYVRGVTIACLLSHAYQRPRTLPIFHSILFFLCRCVLRRNPLTDEMKVIWTSETMPTLKQVCAWLALVLHHPGHAAVSAVSAMLYCRMLHMFCCCAVMPVV